MSLAGASGLRAGRAAAVASGVMVVGRGVGGAGGGVCAPGPEAMRIGARGAATGAREGGGEVAGGVDPAREDVAIDEVDGVAARGGGAGGVELQLVDEHLLGGVAGGAEGARIVRQLAELGVTAAAHDGDGQRPVGRGAEGVRVPLQRGQQVGGVGAVGLVPLPR